MKTKILKPVIICILSIGVLVKCAKKDDTDEIIQVRYGTSFGFCLGYCKKDLTLKSGTETITASGWNDTIVTKTCTETLENSSWDSLKTGLDITTFFTLPVTIGCPDCADGGAEWLELKLANGNSHRVTFEYNNEPEVLKDYIPELRDFMREAGKCTGN